MPFWNKRKGREKEAPLGKDPFLRAVKPKERYHFCSDYFRIDSGRRIGCILSFFHINGAEDRFAPFWGIVMMPRDLPRGVSVIRLEQISRMTEGWIDSKQNKAEHVAEMDSNDAKSHKKRYAAGKKNRDLQSIAAELSQGASYLCVHFRLLIKAPDLDTLDLVVKRLNAQYTDWYQTLQAGTYFGEQRKELSALFAKNAAKLGKPFGFTSQEYAGAYSLVTHGLDDPGGEYVGVMTGDVNNSAVMFEVNGYDHHVVIGCEGPAVLPGKGLCSDIRATSMWGSKLSQGCLLENGRVVHMILDGTDLNKLGPEFRGITSVINMNQGDLNMFEAFGDSKDELSIFPVHMQKLALMAEHAYETNAHDRGIIHGSFVDVATRFYIENRMWMENAADNRQHLRLVGIPHEEVPCLEMLVSYLAQAYKRERVSSSQDPELMHALNVLYMAFKDLLQNNGDLFNTVTSKRIDGAAKAQRVIYDFSGLERRGKGIAMAQFINVLGYAAGSLKRGDLLLLHGAEKLSDSVKEYALMQFDGLYEKGARMAFLYNKLDAMIEGRKFSGLDKADFILLGSLTETYAKDYQQALGREMPPDLIKNIAVKDPRRFYINRGVDNVVFTADLDLGIGA